MCGIIGSSRRDDLRSSFSGPPPSACLNAGEVQDMAVVERSPPTPSLDTHRWPACCRSLSDLSREEHEHVLVGDDGGDDNCPAARPLHCRQSRSRTRPAWCRTPTTGPAAGSARFTSCGSKRANGTLTAGTNTSASCWACVSCVGATGSATDSARIAPGGRRWWIPRPQRRVRNSTTRSSLNRQGPWDHGPKPVEAPRPGDGEAVRLRCRRPPGTGRDGRARCLHGRGAAGPTPPAARSCRARPADPGRVRPGQTSSTTYPISY
jgi:hypothetical protein